MLDALSWYVVVQAASLAVWPLLLRGVSPLEDRGWGIAKTVGVLVLSRLVWLVCMLTGLPFERATLFIGLLVIAAVAWGARGTRGAIETWQCLVDRRLTIAYTEAAFLGAFVLFGLLRAMAPAVSGTEKPMDMAFLDGFMTAHRLPTQDSWLAGFSVPYF